MVCIFQFPGANFLCLIVGKSFFRQPLFNNVKDTGFIYHFMNHNKKSVMPIIVNPFSSRVSLIGLFTTMIF